MAYSDFTFGKVKEAFQLTIDEKTNLFANTAKVKPSHTSIESIFKRFEQIRIISCTDRPQNSLNL
jgi:hypothetical protein